MHSRLQGLLLYTCLLYLQRTHRRRHHHFLLLTVFLETVELACGSESPQRNGPTEILTQRSLNFNFSDRPAFRSTSLALLRKRLKSHHRLQLFFSMSLLSLLSHHESLLLALLALALRLFLRLFLLFLQTAYQKSQFCPLQNLGLGNCSQVGLFQEDNSDSLQNRFPDLEIILYRKLILTPFPAAEGVLDREHLALLQRLGQHHSRRSHFPLAPVCFGVAHREELGESGEDGGKEVKVLLSLAAKGVGKKIKILGMAMQVQDQDYLLTFSHNQSLQVVELRVLSCQHTYLIEVILGPLPVQVNSRHVRPVVPHHHSVHVQHWHYYEAQFTSDLLARLGAKEVVNEALKDKVRDSLAWMCPADDQDDGFVDKVSDVEQVDGVAEERIAEPPPFEVGSVVELLLKLREVLVQV